jgi:pyruvate kinase
VVKNGDSIFIDDGKIELLVVKIEKNEVHTEVINGGILKSKKGMNLPDTKISAPSVTKKDFQDLLFGLENNVEWVALSFVRRADDIVGVKEIIADKGKQTRVIAKIERPEAIKNIDSIIEATDALMVARGDLGVEVKMEDVPILQKKMVEKCNKEAKPVIIATQMMESMITDSRPTRAEASDVANSVFDGADAVMLSGETAVGKHPVKVIQSMVKIIQCVEQADIIYNKYHLPSVLREDFVNCSLIATACRLAQDTHAKAIMSMTQSGYTAFRIASHRPRAGIFIFSGNKTLLNTVSLIWGVRGFYYDRFESTDSTFADTEEILVNKKLLTKGDVCIQTASMPIHNKSKTNALKVSIVQ